MKTRSKFPHRVRVIENAEIPLADGCRLSARIWLPEDADTTPQPAILEYHPYRKRDGTSLRDERNHGYFAGYGYAAVRVDTRGTGESDGRMGDEYSEQELADGVETIAWIAAQPWCSGAVGLFGLSWGGFNGLQIAARNPPALKAVVSAGSTDDRYAEDCHFKGGCLLSEHLGWAAAMLSFFSRPPDPALVGEGWRARWLDRLAHQPWVYEDWMRHPTRDGFWRHGSVCETPERMTVPTLLAGGWNDAYRSAIFRCLARYEAPMRAIVGPWVHRFPHMGVPDPQIGYLQECLRWWDRWLKGKDSGILREAPVRFFVQDSIRPSALVKSRPGRWTAARAWPRPGSGKRFALNPGGLHPAPGERRVLQVCSPQTTGLQGGELVPMGWGPDQPGDQRADDAGSLVFDSKPLKSATAIAGAVTADLAISVDRKTAFVVVRLCDVHPIGESALVTLGALNLNRRNGMDRSDPIEPGKRLSVTVQLDDVAHRFAVGHRIRIAVSTAYWPMIWPSPRPVTLSLRTAVSSVTLPLWRRRDRPDVRFKPSEVAPSQPRTQLAGERQARTLETDKNSGETTLRVLEDAGTLRHDAHGMVTSNCTLRSYTIRPDDPLSARMESRRTQEMRRGDDWRVRTEVTAGQSCDAGRLTFWASLETFENDRPVFRRDWRRSARRNGF